MAPLGVPAKVLQTYIWPSQYGLFDPHIDLSNSFSFYPISFWSINKVRISLYMTEIVDKQFLDFLLRIPVLIHFAININQSKYLLKIFWQLFWLFVRQSCQKWYSYVRWKSSWDLWPQILQPYIWPSQYDMIHPHISPKNI